MPNINEDDRIVYSPTKDHAMLRMNRIEVTTNWLNQAMTFRDAIDTNPDHLKAFSYRTAVTEPSVGGLDFYDGAMSVVTLNYPGTYIIRACVMRGNSGSHRMATVIVATPPGSARATTLAHVAAGEIAKATHTLTELETDMTAVVYEVPPNAAGTQIQVFLRNEVAGTFTGNFTVAGFNYNLATPAFDPPGSTSGSFVGLTYFGA